MSSLAFLGAGVIGAAAILVTPTAAAPPVFRTGPYQQAEVLAERSQRLFLVDATASWCKPCRMMDRTTWTDQRVVEWIREHAVAVQLDVDKDRKRAKELRIRAMPTVIVFKEGQELDRVRGYRSADQLVTWLDGLLEGKREIDRVREAAGDRDRPDGAVDVMARLTLARELVHAGKLDEATEEFVWLWDNMLRHRPAMYGVRLSFMISDMRELAAQHPPAHAAFTKLRDRYWPSIEGGRPDREELVDWIHLNKVVGEEDVTLAWFDLVKNDPESSHLLDRVENDLFELLAERRRWADAGRVLRDSVARAERMVEINERISKTEGLMREPEAKRAMIHQFQKQRFGRKLMDLYAACLAAGRAEQAEGVAAILLGEYGGDGVTRLELVEVALIMDMPRARHRQWLNEAEAMGEPDADLRAELEEALVGPRR